MDYLFFFLIMMLGGLVQGMSGFGSALVCMSVLTFVFDYKVALPVMYLAGISAAVMILIKTYRHINWKLLLTPLIASFIGRIGGLFVFRSLNSSILVIILGFFIAATAVTQLLFRNTIKIRPSHKNGTIAGLLSGLFGGISGTGGPPMVIYYMNLGIEKYEYISTLQANFLAGVLFSVGMMAASGYYTLQIFGYGLAASAGIISGSIIGLRVFHRINKAALVRLINIILLTMGISLILKNLI